MVLGLYRVFFFGGRGSLRLAPALPGGRLDQYFGRGFLQ